MNAFRRTALFASLFFISIASIGAKGINPSGITILHPLHQDSKEKSASVTGRVTLGGEAAAGIIVIAEPYEPAPRSIVNTMFGQFHIAKATTEPDGSYRLTGVPAGRYKIVLYAPQFVSRTNSESEEEDSTSEQNRTVSLSEGETVDGIDFALTRGGVITGRVIDSQGRPVIGEYISLKRVSKNEAAPSISQYSPETVLTDDRGVYRIYGIPSGSYIVSAGGQDELYPANLLYKRRNNPMTYFPGTTDATRARTIELSVGGEATDINIKLGLPNRSYRATGRVVNTETGKTFADLVVFYNPTSDNSDSRAVGLPSPGGFSSSNAKGEFIFESILPGRYTANVNFMTESKYYSEEVAFEVKNGDVNGLEIKLHRGSTISGDAVVENSADPDISAQISQLIIVALVRDASMPSQSFQQGKINADGSFRIAGIKSGRAQLLVNDITGSSLLQLLRIERDGLEQSEGIEIQTGEQISGVRLVLGKAAGLVSGQVIIQGGQMQKGERLRARARRAVNLNPFSPGSSTAEVDANGRFLIENLLPGDYELEVFLLAESDVPNPRTEIPRSRQSVTVVDETPVDVTIVLDLSAKDK